MSQQKCDRTSDDGLRYQWRLHDTDTNPRNRLHCDFLLHVVRLGQLGSRFLALQQTQPDSIFDSGHTEHIRPCTTRTVCHNQVLPKIEQNGLHTKIHKKEAHGRSH